MPDEYREILLASRKQQLRLTATAVERLRITFDAAVESIRQKIEALPVERQGTAWHRAMLQLTSDIRTVTEGLGRDYTTLLDVGMVELAQNAADREAATAGLVKAPVDPTLLPSFERTLALTNGQSIPVQFGRLALGAVERVTTRYYSDGLKLSDRIHNLTEQSRKVVEDTITQGIVEQISARDMAKRLREVMTELSVDGNVPPKHVAMRIAVTEINTSHREASVMSMQSSPGILKEYISGVRWNLSAAHKEADVCDMFASRESGLGPGVYMPSEFPVSHPWCMCFSTAQLVAFPESGVGEIQPNPDAVPPNQQRTFAEQFPSQALVGAGA